MGKQVHERYYFFHLMLGNRCWLSCFFFFFLYFIYTTQDPIPGLYSSILPQVAYKWGKTNLKDLLHKIYGNIAFLFNMPITGCFISHNILFFKTFYQSKSQNNKMITVASIRTLACYFIPWLKILYNTCLFFILFWQYIFLNNKCHTRMKHAMSQGGNVT